MNSGIGGASFPDFTGLGEGAPLDLSNCSDAALGAIRTRMADRSFDAFAETAAVVGYCARPIRLVGRSETVDSKTGEILSTFSSTDAPLGTLYRACGNRRSDVCPACSRVYARDTFAMIRAGLVGGKTVPESVADNPLLFATFTAPSFGHVHGPRPKAGQRAGARCRPRQLEMCPHGRSTSCFTVHEADDPHNGAPLCFDCYDWVSAVVWQWHAPELWRRTTIALRRAIAARLGVSEADLKKHASLQFAKVAEYQARGLIHFHALIRLDGAEGPGSPAPLDGRALAQLVDQATRAVEVTAAPVDDNDPARVLSWGRQLDIRVVRDGSRTDDPDGPLAPEQVAGYLAKYATKDANSIRRRPDGERIDLPHISRLVATCRDLGARARAAHRAAHQRARQEGLDEPEAPYARLGRWAHMLGFRGHFSTKSRAYSITLGKLRRARARYQALAAKAERAGEDLRTLSTAELEARLLADGEETTLVIGSWSYAGTGWENSGDEALALAAAAQAREHARSRAAARGSSTTSKTK